MIQVINGQRQGHQYEWHAEQTPEAVIGRSPECALCLPEDHISSHHAVLRLRGGQVTFEDLGSTNGSSLLRGDAHLACEPRQPIALRDGDRLLVGDRASPIHLLISVPLLVERADTTAIGMSANTHIIASTQVGNLPLAEGRVSADPHQLRLLYEGLKAMNRPQKVEDAIASGVDLIFKLLAPATHVTVILDRDLSPAAEGQDTMKAGEAVVCIRRDGEAQTPDRPSRWLLKRLRQERAALLLADLDEEAASRSLQQAAIHSMIAAPLFVGDRITGVVQIDHRLIRDLAVTTHVFTQQHLDCAMVVASHLALAIDHALLDQRLRLAEERLRSENRFLKKRDAMVEMVGTSDALRHVQGLIDRVCKTSVSVCILGETGTGKELVARAIHYRSPRRDKLFIAQNCAALPQDLLESELFGHRKGAFTGADNHKKGLFELADGGTIFLDEIGETSPALQAKLLRALQEGEVRPVGSTTTVRVDVRVLSATNRNLEEEVAQGRFREDLYYRLNVFPIQLPPLRERKADIPALVDFFLKKFAPELGIEPLPFSPSAMDLFCAYEWPGNIRELQNEIQRIMICKHLGGYILPEDLSPRIRNTEMLLKMSGDEGAGYLSERLRNVERYIISEALQANDGNKTRTARALGITREGLHKKLARHGVS
jgi:transcriptional regulator with GAF, ATPase, and Fis domain